MADAVAANGGGNAEANSDAYYRELLGRVDAAIAETGTQDSAGGTAGGGLSCESPFGGTSSPRYAAIIIRLLYATTCCNRIIIANLTNLLLLLFYFIFRQSFCAGSIRSSACGPRTAATCRTKA